MSLLLTPHRLLTDHIVLQSFHKINEGKIPDYKTAPLDSSELRKHYSSIPKEARDLLLLFSRDSLLRNKEEIARTFSQRSGGQTLEEYSNSVLLKIMHDRITRLKPYSSLLKWYHKVEKDNGKFLTAPCSFSTFRPQLTFEVTQNENGYNIEVVIDVNSTPYAGKIFRRYQFLLESDNEYFLLSYIDYQTLEWLDRNTAQHSGDPQAFAKHILSKLETDYRVNRNGLFKINEIKVQPVRRVMLSEISNSFLMLRPQWVYDGFVQEYPWKEAVEVTKDGEAVSIIRHKEEEEAFLSLLVSLHPNFNRQLNGSFHLSFADAQKKQWFLKVYHRLLEADVELVGMDMLQHFRYSQHKVKTESSIVEEQDNTILMELKVFFGQEEVPLPDLQKMLLVGQRIILLKDGSLGILPDEWLQEYSAIVRHGKFHSKRIQVSKWLVLSEQQHGGQTQSLPSVLKAGWLTKWKHWLESTEALYELPASLRIEELRSYQRKGYEWLRLLAEAGASACLADDMGLGKTIQTICFLAFRLQENPNCKHLVVCPTSLIYNWQQELEKFVPGMAVAVYHGPQRQAKILSEDNTRLILTSYGTLRSDIELFSGAAFDTVVVDESHNIKNPTALITQAVNQLRSAIRIALSGTPVMNNTFDLYAQLSFLFPGMFGSREFFKKQYADPIDRDRDEDKIKALQKLTAPFILRRTKEQVATDLPAKTETILWCTMKSDQRNAYESIRERIRSSLFLEIKQKGIAAGKLSALNGIMKLRQVCNSCELVNGEDLFTDESVKTQMLIDELKNITVNHKALVFSQFTKMLDLLERDIIKQQFGYLRLDGSVESSERQKLVNRFNDENGKEKLFLISLKAGNAGLNLTAADYVFLFDPWWNTAVEQQAIDRTHRIGQTKNVFAYKLICKDTIEEKIINLQKRKSNMARELIGGEEGFIKQLTEEDLEYLFS